MKKNKYFIIRKTDNGLEWSEIDEFYDKDGKENGWRVDVDTDEVYIYMKSSVHEMIRESLGHRQKYYLIDEARLNEIMVKVKPLMISKKSKRILHRR